MRFEPGRVQRDPGAARRLARVPRRRRADARRARARRCSSAPSARPPRAASRSRSTPVGRWEPTPLRRRRGRRDRRGGPAARAALDADAVRSRPRRAGARRGHAGGDGLRPVDRRTSATTRASTRAGRTASTAANVLLGAALELAATWRGPAPAAVRRYACRVRRRFDVVRGTVQTGITAYYLGVGRRARLPRARQPSATSRTRARRVTMDREARRQARGVPAQRGRADREHDDRRVAGRRVRPPRADPAGEHVRRLGAGRRRRCWQRPASPRRRSPRARARRRAAAGCGWRSSRRRPAAIEPHTFEDQGGLETGGICGEFLTRIDASTDARSRARGQLEAERDATVWTFKLRPNVKFQTGQPMTADDVVATCKRLDLARLAGALGGRRVPRTRAACTRSTT